MATRSNQIPLSSPNQADFADYETFRPTMTKQEVWDWFHRKLGRQPEPQDFYKVSKDFYALGAYSRALLCLQQYVDGRNASPAGRHLMAYCHLNMGDTDRALREFKKCAKDGYHDDWQFVVELTLELEERDRIQQEA